MKIIQFIFIFKIILKIKCLAENISEEPLLISTNVLKTENDFYYKNQNPGNPQETAFTIWFRYNFYQDQIVENIKFREQSDKYSHFAGLYTKHDGTCDIGKTNVSQRYHALFYNKNQQKLQISSTQESVSKEIDIPLKNLDGTWVFAYQSYSLLLKKTVTFLKILETGEEYFHIQDNINQQSINELHFVVGNCKPNHDFNGHFFNPQYYYGQSDIYIGNQSEIQIYYNTVQRPQKYLPKNDNFYYQLIGDDESINYQQGIITDKLEQFAHYKEYAIYGWIKSRQNIPNDTYFQILRISNWLEQKLENTQKCGDREHAIFLINDNLHFTQSNCKHWTNSGQNINTGDGQQDLNLEIEKNWYWFYIGYNYDTQETYFQINQQNNVNKQSKSSTISQFRLQNPQIQIINQIFHYKQFDGYLKNWYVKLGPGSYQDSNFQNLQDQNKCPDNQQVFIGNPKYCSVCQDICQTCNDYPNQCLICKHPLNKTAPECDCDNGYIWDSYPTTCQKCESPCKYCQDLITKCTLCIEGYYLYENNCIQCSYPCKNCTSDNDCLTCQTLPNRKSITDCGCQDTFYDNNTECIKCVYPCLNCTSDTICLSCKTTLHRKSLTDCKCENGFYDDNTECQQCVYPCQNCSSLNSCLTCKTLDNRISTTNCGCIDGFYDNNSTCTQCLYPCLFCENSTVCKSCKTTENRKNNTECACNDTYYDNNTECIKCTYPCLNCTSDTVCLSCSTIDNRKSTTDCNCQDTYYDNNTECTKCEYPCINCTSSDICTSCVEDNNRSNIHPCKCNSGYFDNGSVCEKCHYKCKECQGSSDQCIDSCSDASRDFDKNCECLDGKFDEGVKLCGECIYKCQTCKTSADNCTLCKNGNGRSLVKAECTCQDTFFDDQQENIDCIECVHPCINCTTLTQCTSCVQRDNSDTETCLCLSGFYENTEKLCNQCSPQCQTCTSQPDKCDQCVNTSNRYVAPNCLCKDGFYSDSYNICQACNYPCKKCVSDSICLDCIGNFRNTVQPSSNKCDCQIGYYDNLTECLKCDIQCYSCIENSHKCILCSEKSRQGELCTCKKGYFEIFELACEKCNYKCAECDVSKYNCKLCSEINRNIENNCECNQGFYEDLNSKKCLPCQYPCKKCLSSKTCLECIIIQGELIMSRQQIPNCHCQKGYYQDPINLICLKCHNRCQKCQGSAENCTQCKQPHIRETIQLGCICKQEFYYSDYDQISGQEMCLKCNSNCKKCNKNMCLECINENAMPPQCTEFIQNSRGQLIQSGISFEGNIIITSQKCEVQCSKCVNTIDQCTKCNIGLNRNNNLPDCSCKQGYYPLNNTPDCIQCSKNCIKCINKKICLECDQQLNRIVDKIQGQCICQKGFKEVHGKCKRCYDYLEQQSVENEQDQIQTINNEKCSSDDKSVVSIIIQPSFISSGQNSSQEKNQ